jgi:hypothetical protein
MKINKTEDVEESLELIEVDKAMEDNIIELV